jgi:hypothetical protein
MTLRVVRTSDGTLSTEIGPGGERFYLLDHDGR